MIIEFLLSVLVGFIKLVLGILPNVPATPDAVLNGGNFITSTISSVISVLSMLLTPVLLGACVVIILGMLNFTWIYHSVMWVIRKLPVLNIK